MDTKTLPQAIAGFVKAKNEHDSGALTACFAPDAVVYDDGAEMRGSQAIREWADEVNRKYQLSSLVKAVILPSLRVKRKRNSSGLPSKLPETSAVSTVSYSISTKGSLTSYNHQKSAVSIV